MIVALARRVVAAAVILAAGTAPTVSQEKITLRPADSLPNGHVRSSSPTAASSKPRKIWKA